MKVHFSLAGLALLLVLALFLPLAVAGGSGSEQITNLRAELERLEESDTGSAGVDEIAMARAWLDEAEAALQARDTRLAERRLRRADHTVDLIRALIEVGNLDTATAAQRDRHSDAEQEIARLEEEIRELEARKVERERQLRSLRNQ